MTRGFISTLLSILFFACNVYSQTTNSSPLSIDSDITSKVQTVYPDSNMVQQYLQLGKHKSFLYGENTSVEYDVQQFNSSQEHAVLFLMLMLMLSLLTYVKVVFSKDVDELLQSLLSQNIAQQIFRTQSREISLPSFLLNLNFIVAMSLYVQLILVKYFHLVSFEKFSSTLMFIFLFTFFYLSKIIALKFIGVMFEVNEECEEYIFNFLTVCKTVGLTLIPALFIFHSIPEIFFNLVFIISLLVSAMLAIIFARRGLSTGYKLLYRSVYHFFIYVCVVEISPIFLLFKLLTKIIN